MIDPITRCVRHCAQSRDGRGRWRIERATSAELLASGSTPTIAAMTAHAAAALGAWIHERAAFLSSPQVSHEPTSRRRSVTVGEARSLCGGAQA